MNCNHHLFYPSIDTLRYSTDSLWIKLKENIATIGVTDLKNSLGNVVMIERRAKNGSALKKGESFATIEWVATNEDYKTPLSGSILKYNSKLETNPSLISTDPYGEGWIVQIKTENRIEFDSLLDIKHFSLLQCK